MLCRGDSENIRALQTTRGNRTDELRNISSGVLLLDSSMWRVRILVTRTRRRLELFTSFPETAVKTTSFHKHDHLHRGHSSFLGFAYSKISQEAKSSECDTSWANVSTIPDSCMVLFYRWGPPFYFLTLEFFFFFRINLTLCAEPLTGKNVFGLMVWRYVVLLSSVARQ